MDYGFDIEGIVGMDFLSPVGAVVDLARMEVHGTQSAGDKETINVMATKTADKKTTKKAAAPAATTDAADPMEALAGEVLLMHLHRVLVRLGEPARVPEIAREIGDDVDHAGAGPARDGERPAPLCRRGPALGHRPAVPGQAAAPGADAGRAGRQLRRARCRSPAPPGNWPTSTGAPANTSTRSPRACCAARASSPSPTASPTACAPGCWTSAATRSGDVLFYNYLSADALAPFEAAAAEADWETDPLGSASRLLAAANGLPVDNRADPVLRLARARRGLRRRRPVRPDARPGRRPDRPAGPPLAARPTPWSRCGPLWRAQAAQAAELAPEEPAAEAACRRRPPSRWKSPTRTWRRSSATSRAARRSSPSPNC